MDPFQSIFLFHLQYFQKTKPAIADEIFTPWLTSPTALLNLSVLKLYQLLATKATYQVTLDDYRENHMEFIEKAKIRLDHWITHNDHHHEEYDLFAEQLEDAGKSESAKAIREMIELSVKSTDCLRDALKNL